MTDLKNSPLNEQIRLLIMEYMTAENNKDHAKAEKIHAEIKQLKSLCGKDCID